MGRSRTKSSAGCYEVLCMSLRFMAVSNQIGQIREGNSQRKDDKRDSCSCKCSCLTELEVISMVRRSTQPISTEETKESIVIVQAVMMMKDASPAPENR